MVNNYNKKEKINKYGIIIAILLFSIMVASNIPTPMYALYSIKFNFSSLMISLIFATYVLFLIPSLLFWGQYSDNKGSKIPVIAGIIFEIIGIISFLLAKNVYMLFLARAFQGLAAGAISGPASALLFHYNGKKGAFLTAISTSSGTATGPLFGGLIAEYLPFKFKLVYILSLIIVIIPFILIINIINKSIKHNNFKFHFPVIDVKTKNLFILSSASAFVAWSITAFYMSLSPVYIIDLLKISNIAVSGLMVFIMLGIASMIQIISMRYNIFNSIVTGMFSLILAMVLIIISLPFKSIEIFIAGTVLAGIGQGFAFAGSTREIRTIAPPLKSGDILSNYYIIIYSGVGVPVIVLGFLDVISGLFTGIIYYGMALISISIVIIIYLYKYKINIIKD